MDGTFHDALTLVGLDVGSTTTSLMVAAARLVRNCVTGRNELGDIRPLFRPDPVFTPFCGETLNIIELTNHVDSWLRTANLNRAAVSSGGALVTGLAARASNALAVKQLVKERFAQAVVAATDDPCLESWLAFMGNALELSRAEPARPFINLDIGGGTTNIAWGLAGDVRHCGCYYVGARHIQVEPGTYRITAISSFVRGLLAELGAAAEVGAELEPRGRDAILDFYTNLLEASVTGSPLPPPEAVSLLHCQVEFRVPTSIPDGVAAVDPVITLSGGVGELAYRAACGELLPGTTAFGDLGIDLARRICASPVLGRNLKSHVPAGLGRATVNGLAVHGTEVAGATLFLPHPEILPLTDLPILGTIGTETRDDELTALLDLAARAAEGACLRIAVEDVSTPTVKALGQRLAAHLSQKRAGRDRPLVLLAAGNFGKTLGQYSTRWGQLKTALVVIDEIAERRAHFATVGKPRNGLVPVSFHGLESQL